MEASFCFEMNGFTFNRAENVIEKSGNTIKLTNKLSEVLALLLKAEGTVVSRDTLLQEIWPQRFGADESLSRVISDLRKKLEALEEGLSATVETIPKRGYKFNASVIKFVEIELPYSEQPNLKKPSHLLLYFVALFVTAVALAHWSYSGIPESELSLNGIAVLTFDDLSSEPKLMSLPVGITEEILHILATETDMRVISRKSSHYFSEKHLPITDIARQLGVRFIVDGSIQRQDNLVKISTRIIDGENGQQVSSANFSFKGTDIFNMQRDVAHSIAMTTSSLATTAQQADIIDDVDYETQLRFLSLKASVLELAPENLEQLQNDVQQIVNNRPAFEDAQFLLSSILSMRANWVQIEEATAFEMSTAILQGKEESHQANPLYWFARAMMLSPRATTPNSGDAALALKYFDKAYHLAPQSTLVLEWYILALQLAEKNDYAKQLAEIKLETDPFNATLLDGLAMYHYTKGEYEQSRKYALRLSAVDKQKPDAPSRLAYIHIVRNEIFEADIQAQECLERSIRFMNCWVHKAEVHEYTGEDQVKNQVYQVMKKLAPPVAKAITLHQLNHNSFDNKVRRIEAYLNSVKEDDFNIGFFPQVYLYALTQLPNGQQAPYIELALSRVSGGQAILFRSLLFPDDTNIDLSLVQEVNRVLNNKQRNRYHDYYLAQLYAQLGRFDDALDILALLIDKRAIPASFQRFYGIESDPFFRQMREKPRFSMLLSQHIENKRDLKLAISQSNKTAHVIARAMAL